MVKIAKIVLVVATILSLVHLGYSMINNEKSSNLQQAVVADGPTV